MLKRRAETTAVSFVPQRNRAANAVYLLLNRLYQFGRNVFREQPPKPEPRRAPTRAVPREEDLREKKLLKGQG